MQKKSINLIIISTLVILLSACGGGGSDSSSQVVASDSSSQVVASDSSSQVVASDSSSQVVASDSSSQVVASDSSVDSTKLILMDAGAISALKVMCDSVELMTAINGVVKCEETPVSVYLGEFKLGEINSIPTDRLIYVQDLLHVTRGAIAHPEVTKVSMILQSLDKDADPLNGITLDSNVIALLGSYLNSDTTLEDLTFVEIENMIADVIRDVLSQDPTSKLKAVSYDTAQSNLATSVANAPALTYEQRTMGGV